MNKANSLERALRLFLCIALMGVFCLVPTFAATNEYVENAVSWVLDGIFWIAVAMIVWFLIKAVLARNLTGAILLLVSGALVVALIGNPELLKTLGNKLLGIIGLTS